MHFLRVAIPCALVLLWTSSVAAQGGIAEGVQLLERAEFESAVAAFDRAEAATEGLSRANLIALYVNRAAAQLALQQGGRMREDLRRLATLNPDHHFDAATRPEIVEAFQGLRGREVVGLRAEVSEDPGGARVSGEVTNDVEELARSVRVRARIGDGDWQEGDGSLVLPAAVGGTVEYVVEVIGPGGAVLANEGTESAPATHALGGATAGAPQPDDPLADDDDDGNIGLIVGIVAGVAAIALVVAIIAVAATSGNDQTAPDAPMIF